MLLWARPGAVDALTEYEDRVLALLGEHDGRVLHRVRTRADGTSDDAPTEIQLIEFGSPAGYDAFVADDRRAALAEQRDRAIARTEIYPVDVV
ncbi:hypothetical protein GCM10027605_36570 [Micromonospora zhanjiangensis]